MKQLVLEIFFAMSTLPSLAQENNPTNPTLPDGELRPLTKSGKVGIYCGNTVIYGTGTELEPGGKVLVSVPNKFPNTSTGYIVDETIAFYLSSDRNNPGYYSGSGLGFFKAGGIYTGYLADLGKSIQIVSCKGK